jgi:hypothetical protein
MSPAALDLDEAARRRESPLDAPGIEIGERGPEDQK